MVRGAFIALMRVLARLQSKQAPGGDLAEKMPSLVHLLDWFPKAGYCSVA